MGLHNKSGEQSEDRGSCSHDAVVMVEKKKRKGMHAQKYRASLLPKKNVGSRAHQVPPKPKRMTARAYKAFLLSPNQTEEEESVGSNLITWGEMQVTPSLACNDESFTPWVIELDEEEEESVGSNFITWGEMQVTPSLACHDESFTFPRVIELDEEEEKSVGSNLITWGEMQVTLSLGLP